MRRGLRVAMLLLLGLLTLAVLFVIAVDPPWAGPVVVVFSPGHGLHRGDVWALGAWAIGVVSCALVWAATRPAVDPVEQDVS